MSLRAEVISAFATLGLSHDVEESVASKAYKKLALIHHPDRNHGDSTATQRFQEVCILVVFDLSGSAYSHVFPLLFCRLALRGLFAKDTTIILNEVEKTGAHMITHTVVVNMQRMMTSLWTKTRQLNSSGVFPTNLVPSIMMVKLICLISQIYVRRNASWNVHSRERTTCVIVFHFATV